MKKIYKSCATCKYWMKSDSIIAVVAGVKTDLAGDRLILSPCEHNKRLYTDVHTYCTKFKERA
jgi:hypothetical protein